MEPVILNKDFFIRPATEIAPKLIGKILCKRLDSGEIIKRMITETECYFGTEDTACHAKRGITKSNEALFMEGGTAYVYLCYGIHYLFNIVTGKEGHGEGVLIRSIEGAAGPGRVTKFLNIDKSLNFHDLCTSDLIWVEDSNFSLNWEALPRIGIEYASSEDKARLWRFLAKL